MKKDFTKDKIFRAAASLILAIFLWMMANANMDPTRTIRYSNIPVEYTNLSSELIVDNPVNSINIKVEGASSRLNKISKGNIKASVDLGNITKAGEYTLEVKINGIPDDVSINEISSKYILVKIGNYTDAESDFVIEATGKTASGYVLLDTYHDDVSVSMSGSDNITKKVYQIKGIIDVSGKNSSYTENVKLNAYDSSGELLKDIKITPESINVNVIISQLKSVPVNPVTTGECNEGYNVSSISLSSNEVTIAASDEILAAISSLNTNPIDISGKDSSFDTEISFALPDGVSLYSEQKYTAHVQIESVAGRTFTYTNIQIHNLKPNHICTFNNFSELSVTIIGQENVLDKISEDDIAAYIDLTDLGEGEHEVNIQYTLPNGVTVSSTSQNKISVNIMSE